MPANQNFIIRGIAVQRLAILHLRHPCHEDTPLIGCQVRVGQLRISRDVHADGGQHLAGHPMLENLRLRQLRGENQSIETAFIDDDDLSLVVRTGVANRDGGFVFLVNVCSTHRGYCCTPAPLRRPYLRRRSHPSHLSLSGSRRTSRV